MGTLIKRFIDVCLFKAKPQDIPSSGFLLAASAAIFILAQTLTDVPGHGFLQSMVIGVAQVVALGLFVMLLLKFRNLADRWRQTVTALYGTAAVIQFVSWPIVGWLARVQESPEIVAPRLFTIAVGLWYFAITAAIFKEAVGTNTTRAIGLAILCQICVFFAVIPFVNVDPIAD